MAGTSLLALIDDIASTLDDIAVLTKIATKKTAGVLGDDLALNAQQVVGVSQERELKVVWSVAKGSAVNKIILIPLALFISAYSQNLVQTLLLFGGLFLCFEGFEKVFEKISHKFSPQKNPIEPQKIEATIDPELFEKQKIKGAVKTDFILSAEIIVITLGGLTEVDFFKKLSTLVLISIIMTVGVYGLVGAIVKLDDLGLFLMRNPASRFRYSVGEGLLKFAPLLLKFLGVAGTIAMFLVGGDIVIHYFHSIHHFQESLNPVLKILMSLGMGLTAGGLSAALIHAGAKVKTVVLKN
jgi:predicted DNA repair protein MutK